MTTQYTLNMRISAIGERTRLLSAKKDEGSGQVTETRESDGYWVTLEPGGISYCLGNEAPSAEWVKGATVETTLRVKP